MLGPIGFPPPEAMADKKVTIILCQDPSADLLGGIGKAQHHKPLQSGERTAGLAILVPPPRDLDILCPRHTSRVPQDVSTHAGRIPQRSVEKYIKMSHSARCGLKENSLILCSKVDFLKLTVSAARACR